MKESIVCIGSLAEQPYCFPETGTQVFSYEELCYYISNHMICYLHGLPEEELLTFIREELKLERLYRQLAKLTDADRDQMKYFSALFREGNYFSEDEIRKILDEYRNAKNAPPALQYKWMGDVYMNAGRASMALESYGRALEQDNVSQEEAGAIWHNMGVACARLFRFHDAGIRFVKAYQYRGDEESLFAYFCLNALEDGIDKAKEELEGFQVSELLMESFEERFARLMEEMAHSEASIKKDKIQFLLENGKEVEGQHLYRKMLREFQADFRPELEKNDYPQ